MIARLLVLLALVTLAGTARADDPGLRAAKRHFERGEKLYALAKFQEALHEYQEAFDAKPIPELLFNIGQCYRNLEDYESAIFSYRKYLKLAPDAANRGKVERLIDELEAKQEQRDSKQRGLQKPAPAEVEAPEDDDGEDRAPRTTARPVYKKWWFWTGLVVVAGGGGVLAYELTRPSAPATNLGNIDFGK